MKKTILSFLIIGIVCLIKVNAQNPVTTLQHNGTTQVYYGQSSFSDALGAAVNGDTLVLSAGFFTAPTSISKGVKVYGSGHFPDSANIPKRTTIMSGLSINAGADSLRLEGLYINGDINYDANNSINYVSIIRCRLGNAVLNCTSNTNSKNYCSFEECFINTDILYIRYGINLLVKYCIINGGIGYVNGNALIQSNIIMGNYWPSMTSVISSQIFNNIIYGHLTSCTGNIINNNSTFAS